MGCAEESTEEDTERHDEEDYPRGFYRQVHLVDLLQKLWEDLVERDRHQPLNYVQPEVEDYLEYKFSVQLLCGH